MKNVSTDNFKFQKEKAEKVPEDIRGEESVSGSTPLPESDDDTLDMEHEMGLYKKEDEAHPKESGLGEEVNEAEEEWEDYGE